MSYLRQNEFVMQSFSDRPKLILLFITCIFYSDGERGVRFHPRQFTTEKKIQSHGEDWKEYIVHTIFLSLLKSKTSIYLPWNTFLPHLSILLRFHLFLSLRHDVAEVAGLTSFSFGEDEESRYVMLFKKVRVLWNPVLDLKTIFLVFYMTDGKMLLWQEFAPSDEELEAYRKGEEWDPKLAEQRRRLKVRLVLLCFSYVCVYIFLLV